MLLKVLFVFICAGGLCVLVVLVGRFLVKLQALSLTSPANLLLMRMRICCSNYYVPSFLKFLKGF